MKVLFLWLLILTAGSALAQATSPETEQPSKNGEQQVFRDQLGRETPRGSVTGFLQAIDSGDYTLAAEFLDLRNLPREVRKIEPSEIASNLAVVIERNIWLDPQGLSENPKGVSGDGLPPYRDKLAVINRGEKEYILLLQRVPDGAGQSIWKISNATVADLKELYDVFGYGPITKYFAKRLPNQRILGVDLFKWVMGAGASVLGYLLFWVLGHFCAHIFVKQDLSLRKRLKYFLTRPLAFLIAILIGRSVLADLGLGLSGQALSQLAPLGMIALVWTILSLVSLIQYVLVLRLNRQERPGAVVLLRPVTNVFKIIILFAIIIEWLQANGFNVTTFLAGLGVGGIAVALALQKPLEDFFAAVTLVTQQNIRIGNFCRIGDVMGTVEEIGLRSTRVRTLGNTIVSFPNSLVVRGPIENFTERDTILYMTTLRLKLDNTGEQVENVLQGLRDVLKTHDRILDDRSRIRFERFGMDAIELVAFIYIDTRDFSEYLRYVEDVNLQFIKVFDRLGIQLALPAREVRRLSQPGNGEQD